MISLIIPIFNEENNIIPLYNQVTPVLNSLNQEYEIIFIDDGSSDSSFNLLSSLKEKDSRIIIIKLLKNYGKSKALSAGFNEIQGDIIVTMDGDLQDDPAEIPHLLNTLNHGYDMVGGWRKNRKDNFWKILTSIVFNFIIRLFTGVKIHDINCGLKAFKKEVISEILDSHTLHRFLPVIITWYGFNITEITVAHHKRIFGKSKYGIEKIPIGLGEFLSIFILLKYSYKPFYILLTAGLLSTIIGLVILIYLTYLWFKGFGLSSRPLLHFGILLLIIGIQILLVSILIGISIISHKKDRYKIKEKL